MLRGVKESAQGHTTGCSQDLNLDILILKLSFSTTVYMFYTDLGKLV